MANFDELNRQTREFNNRNMSRPITSADSAPRYGTREYWQNYWNNQTYKGNNGEYARHYY